ncbi:hypothetical protein GUITHDRAFT_165144 [Guillardia theta CCMP2712]|uniref:EamA domain-containing protein n=1 Tax=Guillardia theta (strain CCMP2712) TaxID=905079 RepID=L1IRA9_GUITC|nr:hypothetical protein GUITHDRAFT_165144 [Guillardia theta CCMP2712]EKX38642.1 hypothetical protein GUITHDRAFT_165144 [Guillardia theta CCMP2712]|eukprot:XP_005825622.1 hypothetical protein GUITHDRAFT_165144 [Guillardia theta CCMP2712]
MVPCARPALAVLTGQFVSLLLVGTSVTSALLVHRGFEAPMFMSCLNYAFLAVAYGSWYLLKGRHHHDLSWKHDKSTMIKFAILVLVLGACFAKLHLDKLDQADVEANYLIVKAYQYTSIISITLLDCFTIPTVMLLSYLNLGSRYTITHGIGVAFALGGLFTLVLIDFSKAEEAGAGNGSVILGDSLTIIAASLYGLCGGARSCLSDAMNIQEELVCRYGWQLVVAIIGVLGALVSSVQVLALEREEIANYSWSGIDVGLIFAFVFCLCSIYTIVPQVLLRTGAAFLNISILTSDFWAVAFGVSVLKENPSSWYYVSFVSTVVGLFIYHARGEPHRSLDIESAQVTLQDDQGCVDTSHNCDDDARMLIQNQDDVN